MRYSRKIVEAFGFAFKAHFGMLRKDSDVPYIVHPIDVASILMKNGASEEVVAAGLLHDVIEDTGVTKDQISKQFGEDVAELVYWATEPEQPRDDPDKKKTWKPRKAVTIEKIKKADREMKILSCADKLFNIRDTIEDHNRCGDACWEKFNASREDIAWYYRSCWELSGQVRGTSLICLNIWS